MADTKHIVNSGFYDAINRDRTYTADDMTMPYKRLVADGIFTDETGAASSDFQVTAASGMNITVKPGNAICGGKWVELASDQTITVSANTSGSTRTDSVILRVSTLSAERAAYIVYRTGSTAAPALINDTNTTEFRLANITVASGASSIAQSNITDTRGGAECPWVTSLINSNVSEGRLTAAVSSWLDENVDPVGSAVMVDSSLSISGAAADAKVTGDEFLRTIKSHSSITAAQVPDTYADLTSIPKSSMLAVAAGASANLTDSPFPGSAFYIISGTIGTGSFDIKYFQIAIAYTTLPEKPLAIRTYNIATSTYSDWIYFSNASAVDAKFAKTFQGYSSAITDAGTYTSMAEFEAGSIHYLTIAGVSAMSDAPDYAFAPMTVMTGVLYGAKKLFQIAYPMQPQVAGCFAIRNQYYSDETWSTWKYIEPPLTPFANEATIHAFINSRLEHAHDVVKLGVGDFHITGSVHMPEGTTLEGSGQGTRIICHGTARVGMTSGCTVRNIQFVGAGDEIELTTEPTGDDLTTGVGFVASTPQRSIIENCWFYNFSSCGVILYSTGTPVDHNVLISNCFFYHCNRGLFIKADSEFHRVTNCSFTRNGIGILTRGGNNNFVNCGLDANIIGIQFDQDEGSNNGHSLMSSCTVNHSDNNEGYGIIIKDTGRIIISNCNIYYSKIGIYSSNGNIIGNCGFGSCEINVTGAGCNIIHDNMFRVDAATSINLPSNHKCKLHDNYYRNGDPVVPIIA